MIDRTYRCDLCRDSYDLTDLVPIRFEKNAETGWVDHLYRASGIFSRECERHLCGRCINDIKRL